MLADHPLYESPFNKIFEIEVDKFKMLKPLKRNCGIGKVSIQTYEFTSENSQDKDKKSAIYKLVFKNVIEKTLYGANIVGTHSK